MECESGIQSTTRRRPFQVRQNVSQRLAPPPLEILLRLFNERVEATGSRVLLTLLVPCACLKLLEPLSQLRHLGRRQSGDGGFDLFNAQLKSLAHFFVNFQHEHFAARSSNKRAVALELCEP